MASIKQIQMRLLIKKNALQKLNLDVTKAEKSDNKTAHGKLTQERGSLNKEIMKLERLQTIMEKASRKNISADNTDED
jgi:hypothetical protein